MSRVLSLSDIINNSQIQDICKLTLGEGVKYELRHSDVTPAVDGIAGFLGDHMKAVLNVQVGDDIKIIHLFIKRIPVSNKPKAEYIDEKNFFRREKFMFKVIDDIWVNGQTPWCARAFIYTDSLIVMPDISFDGYKTCNYLEVLDTKHVFAATASIASFHAAFFNYETKKSIELNRPYNTYKELGHILNESTFVKSPFVNACSKLSANIIKKFSKKPNLCLPDLEEKLTELYYTACETMVDYKDTINVLIHRDLWVNNIMFKYVDEVEAVNAVLIDYQCLRYGPPAFDLMIFMYLTTDRLFRDQQEKQVIDHYYYVFNNYLNEHSKQRLALVQYDKDTFIHWCERARMFGMLIALGLFPYILMDPKNAKETFDDPETFHKYNQEDRTEPVLAYADKCEPYKLRNLEVTEEFVETYILKQ